MIAGLAPKLASADPLQILSRPILPIVFAMVSRAVLPDFTLKVWPFRSHFNTSLLPDEFTQQSAATHIIWILSPAAVTSSA